MGLDDIKLSEFQFAEPSPQIPPTAAVTQL
jgi:hypothetical protein